MAAPPPLSQTPPDPPPIPLLRRISSPRRALRLLSSPSCHSPRRLRQAHAHLLRCGLAGHPSVLAALLRRYTSLRGPAHLRAAAATFSDLPFPPPPFAWNLMIRTLTLENRPLDGLLSYYNSMIAAGVQPDEFTLPFAVKACTASGELRKGMELHGFAIKSGLAADVYLQNALMNLYLHCQSGDAVYAHLLFVRMSRRNIVSWTTLISGLIARGQLEFARGVFEEMPLRRNVVTWTALIDAYARSGRPEEAFELFRRMQVENVEPNEFTVVALLIASNELGSLELGRWVHCLARQHGGLDSSTFVGTALVDMYSCCGSLIEARKMFDQMPERTLATWNSMITSYGVHGHGAEAVTLFKEMESSGVFPDEITFHAVLSACTRAQMGKEAVEFFHVMREKYQISPTAENYRCLAELLDQARELEKENLRLLLCQLHFDTRRALLAACYLCGATTAEDLLRSSTDEDKRLALYQ